MSTVLKFKEPKKHLVEFSYLTYGITCGECKKEFEQVSGNMEVNAGRIRAGDRVVCSKCKTELGVKFAETI